jgi:hypothetical protein
MPIVEADLECKVYLCLRIAKAGVMVDVCNPSYLGDRARRSLLGGQPGQKS